MPVHARSGPSFLSQKLFNPRSLVPPGYHTKLAIASARALLLLPWPVPDFLQVSDPFFFSLNFGRQLEKKACPIYAVR